MITISYMSLQPQHHENSLEYLGNLENQHSNMYQGINWFTKDSMVLQSEAHSDLNKLMHCENQEDFEVLWNEFVIKWRDNKGCFKFYAYMLSRYRNIYTSVKLVEIDYGEDALQVKYGLSIISSSNYNAYSYIVDYSRIMQSDIPYQVQHITTPNNQTSLSSPSSSGTRLLDL
ncbi:hypothetical protein BDC45DRAFT_535406 [Circinella umbellata]|nr:hypothetical protein BDC45DRAFT_535406 [Circinella umbellata]